VEDGVGSLHEERIGVIYNWYPLQIMVGFFSTCKHSTSLSTMRRIIIHYVSCHHSLACHKITGIEVHIDHLRMILSQQNEYYASMYNVVYKRMLSCNHFGVYTFTFHFKILFNEFPQQRVGIT
jgi:hypothetical protein